MSGSGDSGTGAEPTPCHIHPYPTTNHALHTQQAPQPRPRLFCPHSPNCTQPTGTSRCPAPTRHPGLASAPLMRSKRRPPRPKHPTFTQFHRSGLRFGRIHPQHRPICPHSPISARNPRVHHAARPPPGTPASHPPHSCAQNADHLAQNTPHSPNFTEVVCALGASIPNTVRSAHIHQSLHATHGYTTLPGPHQAPRPRIRPIHALKTQTTSPKTPHIRSISPKWSALWAHPSPTPSDLPRFAKLHATHGYTTLPGPHQMPRPRIRPIHALKTQTTSPKTPHIHPIPPKWSALWAHTVQLEARRRRHNGCAYDLHHCGARTLHHRCEQH